MIQSAAQRRAAAQLLAYSGRNRSQATFCSSTDHGGGKRRLGINQKLISHIGESANSSRPRAYWCGQSWTHPASGKRPPSACELPEACRGITRVGCSSQTWPSASTVRRKILNCKIFRRKRTAGQPRMHRGSQLLWCGSAYEVRTPSRSPSRPALRAKFIAKSSYCCFRTGSSVTRASDIQTWA